MEKVLDSLITFPEKVNLRFERKFVLERFKLDEIIENVVYSSPYGFKEVYSRRTINNIYLDDYRNSFYHENVSGDGWRKKYRVRWYGEDFMNLTASTFEIKKKFGEVGDKLSYKMNNFRADLQKDSIDVVHEKLIKALEAEHPILVSSCHLLFPKLYNTYERRYFLSFCEKFRITLDYNMKYCNPNYDLVFEESSENHDEVILELKYSTEHDKESRILSQKIYQRLSKNSKYVRGVDLVYN